ncbi:NADH-quinone oxidoreductase subunit L [Bacillus kwashiorkori]|uniref:NADH-quinone oxidoreductase subunit L n=1 Tax=Bacillus kwashiorkori TaxID=1522318 RepID=UPI0007841719|nr:NADH-quinone oxidoreductase subunit L [Bacillus kwashiorkori]
MMTYAWVIPLFPFIASIILLMFGKRIRNKVAEISISFTSLSFIGACILFFQLRQAQPFTETVTWYRIANFEITVGFTLNELNLFMLLIVSLVSLLVQIYSIGYMGKDVRLPIYYAYLGLFTGSMLALVISPNLLQIYFFWELVGLGSFLLIGYYFSKESAKKAAKKAFIMTRIGDAGLLIGILILFWQTNTFDLAKIFTAITNNEINSGTLTAAALLIFIGAIGKSGQFPLHSWLPDAMEGPTPVSALIHAATMVAAGVYLVATMYPLFLATKTALMTVAIIGALTAFFAATVALIETDMKRILAYSTVSQLGFMFLALGTLGYTAAIFHLMTHAFFKALLFLSAGNVITYAKTQNINELGNLRKRLPFTNVQFFIGTLAITGIPLLSGFFSKDEIILATATSGNIPLLIIALITTILTAAYMFRLYFTIFHGQPNHTIPLKRLEKYTIKKTMVIPGLTLTVLAVASGYINTSWFGTFLSDWLTRGKTELAQVTTQHDTLFISLTIFATFIGLIISYLIYIKKTIASNWFSARAPITFAIMKNGYYIDTIYYFTIIKLATGIGKFFRLLEFYIIECLTNIVTAIVTGFGRIGSSLHNGNNQRYGAVVVIGMIVLVVITLWTGGYF